MHTPAARAVPAEPVRFRRCSPRSQRDGVRMTVTTSPVRGWQRRRQGRQRAVPANRDLVDLTDRRRRRQRAQGHPGHPGRRAGRHPDPAVLRPPAARPGRRLPPVPRRRRDARPATAALRPMPKPQASCTMTVVRGHGGQDPAHVAGRRQGAAGRHGAAAHQPPARLPGLRQGRRVPPAEPGDEQRPPASPVRGRQAHLPQADQHLLAGAARPRALRALRPLHPLLRPGRRRPVHRAASSAARCSRSASTRRSRSSRYFSGNTVQICPVGALTGAAYRFRARPFDLVSTPQRLRALRQRLRASAPTTAAASVLRRMALNDPAVNEEWNCDKGRWAFAYATLADRIDLPMVRDDERRAAGRLAGPRRSTPRPRPACAARRGRRRARRRPRVSAEDAYAYGKFARIVLGTNDIDFRARPHSAEEADFLASHVVATGPDGGAVTYADLERARTVLLVGFEPEDESPDRLPAAAQGVPQEQDRRVCRRARSRRAASTSSAARSAGRARHRGRGPRAPWPTAPRRRHRVAAAAEALAGDGAVVLVGERLADVPGALSRGRRPRRRHRRPPGLGPAPRRRARCPRGRCAAARCCPAAARSPSAAARAEVGRGLGRRRPARPRRPRHRRHHRGGRRRRARRPRRRRRRPGRPRRARRGRWTR